MLSTQSQRQGNLCFARRVAEDRDRQKSAVQILPVFVILIKEWCFDASVHPCPPARAFKGFPPKAFSVEDVFIHQVWIAIHAHTCNCCTLSMGVASTDPPWRSAVAGGISHSRRTAGSATDPLRLAESRVRGGRNHEPQTRGGFGNLAFAAGGRISHRSGAAGGISRSRRTAESATDPRRLAEIISAPEMPHLYRESDKND